MSVLKLVLLMTLLLLSASQEFLNESKPNSYPKMYKDGQVPPRKPIDLTKYFSDPAEVAEFYKTKRDQFKEMDKNEDLRIDANELKDYFKKTSEGSDAVVADVKEAEDFMIERDRDDDGVISVEEFIKGAEREVVREHKRRTEPPVSRKRKPTNRLVIGGDEL